MSANFVHLHVHSQYSILDSTLKIKDAVSAAKEMNMPALALTDNSCLFGAVAFFEECRKNGIKPLIGSEIYIAPKGMEYKTKVGIPNESYSIVLFAKNPAGYTNLCTLITEAHFKGFYYRPRVDIELLKKHSAGLVCLSGNHESELFSLICQNRDEAALKWVDTYKNIFEDDSFFIECVDHGHSREKIFHEKIQHLARSSGVPVVAANDCHYLRREDSFAHNIARCIAKGRTLNQSRSGLEGMEYYFKSPEEMADIFNDMPEALTNTLKVAEMCNFEFDLKTRFLPEFKPPEGFDQGEYLLELCRKGMPGKVDAESSEVKDRLAHEYKIISQMGFISYFLIVWDFINYARKNSIPVGPGRGSAAGSLIAYLLGITNVNPLEHSLFFERFLNPARVSMPDIDIDFCFDRRPEVIEYVRDFYGDQAVAQIITFGTLAARAVIRDVGRVMDIPLPKVDMIAKLIPGEPKMTLKKAREQEPKINELIEEDREIEALFNNAMKLEGFPRNTSIHAAGTIISKGALTDRLPLYKGQGNETITQFDGPTCEKIGLLKMDFLGLKTLTVLTNSLKMAMNSPQGISISTLDDIPMDDDKTYDLLTKGNTLAVFQLESRGMRELMRKLGVENFADIVALVALYRPGPLQMADDFIQRKHGTREVVYSHPDMEGILKETYGIMLYQEQVMQCVQVLGGYTLAEADILRRIMGKKKKEEMDAQRDKFVEGCVKNNIDRKVAEEIFLQMETFAGYGFNKSHSVAYALIAYQTAWFKANYPKEFMAANLSMEKNNTDKLSEYIEESRSMGIAIQKPSVNHSQIDFSVEGEGVRFGLSAIKNVGEGAAETIIVAREQGGAFSSLEDFAKRVDSKGINRKTIENLTKAGAFDELEDNRNYVFEIIDDIIKFGSSSRKDQQLGQESFIDILDASTSNSMTPKQKSDYPDWPEHERLKMEKELLGCYISGHPLSRFARVLKRFSTASSVSVKNFRDSQEVRIGGVISSKAVKRTAKGDLMAILVIEDLKGTIEAVVYPRTYETVAETLIDDQAVLIQGIVQVRNDEVSIIVNDVCDLEKAQETLTTEIFVAIQENTSFEKLEKLKAVAESYPGACRLSIDLKMDNGKTLVVRSSSKYSISPCMAAVQEIEDIFGEESFWLHIREMNRQTLKPKNFYRKK